MLRHVWLLSLIAAVYGELTSISFEAYWKAYKQRYGRSYEDTEEEKRREIWFENVIKGVEHNIGADLGMHTFMMKLNSYSDRKPHEFLSKYPIGPDYFDMLDEEGDKIFEHSKSLPIPDHINWVEKGYVTEVIYQGTCSGCWAISIVGALEGQWKAATGKLIPMSVQHLLDCTPYPNRGCLLGNPIIGYDYLKKCGGIQSEKSYPFIRENEECKFDTKKIVANISGYMLITPRDEYALQQAVATLGPIAVAMDFSSASLRHLGSGVYNSDHCGENLNHGVLIVGYGFDKDTDLPYWLIKNSYGKDWGVNGYGKILMNRNQCGIANFATFPLIHN